MSRPARPRLLVISQVYVPDAAAVGQYVADACEEAAARGWDVVVYTSARGYDDPTQQYPADETRHGVTIRRLPLSSFGKRSIPVRLAAQLLFLLQASARALFAGRFASLLVSTSPPFAGFFGAILSTVKRAPLTWWVMDLNPDQMVAAGRLAPAAVLARLFDWMNRVTIRKARAVIVLDRYMKDRVVAKLPTVPDIAAKVHVLPPWSLDTHLEPSPSAAREFRVRHGIEDAFVVMYAGNHSEQNPLDTLLAAADAMSDRSDVKFVFVGGGTGKAPVDARVRAGARNIVSLPYQPLETLAAMLAAADLHVVAVGDTMVGIVHPCKIYSAMAVARPILVFGPDRCHASDIVADAAVGWHVRHGDVAGAVAAITTAQAMPATDRGEMGSEAATIIATRYSRAGVIDRFLSLAAPPLG
jgi:glycosyltransferase involved in cell wall biosynthesis